MCKFLQMKILQQVAQNAKKSCFWVCKKGTCKFFICRNLQHFPSRTYARANKQTNKRTNEQTKIEKENKKKRWNITQDVLSTSSTLTHRSRDKHKQILIPLILRNMGSKEEVENKACRRGSAWTHSKSILAKIAKN